MEDGNEHVGFIHRQISTSRRPDWPYHDWTYQEIQTSSDGTGCEDLHVSHRDKDIQVDNPNAASDILPTGELSANQLENIKSDVHNNQPDQTQKVLECTNASHVSHLSMTTSEKSMLTSIDQTKTELDVSTDHDPAVSQETKSVHSDNNSIASESESDHFEPDHYADFTPINGDMPVLRLISHLKEEYSCDPDEAEAVKSDIVQFMENTLKFLEDRYDIFEGSYIRLVGSAAELSKIGNPDEFDFAVLLPVFANEKVFSLLFREEAMMQEEQMTALLCDLEAETPHDNLYHNFHHFINILWFSAMEKTIPKNWQFNGGQSCYLDSDSIAATFHLIRKADHFMIDVDFCFWIPITKQSLELAPDSLVQRDFLLANGFDKDDLIYAMLPKDNAIELKLNSTRFATSFLENEWLNQFGPDNGRLTCYRLSKCIAKTFLPKVKKRETCDRCWDCIVSSFCLKQIILYMIKNYKSDDMWSEQQLGNRVLEVFSILQFSLVTNGCMLSSFFSPYEILISSNTVYQPNEGAICDRDPYYIKKRDEEEELGPPHRDSQPCSLPSRRVADIFHDDPVLHKILQRYLEFLEKGEWNPVKVICRLDETLELLREGDPSSREEASKEWHDTYFGIAAVCMN